MIDVSSWSESFLDQRANVTLNRPQFSTNQQTAIHGLAAVETVISTTTTAFLAHHESMSARYRVCFGTHTWKQGRTHRRTRQKQYASSHTTLDGGIKTDGEATYATISVMALWWQHAVPSLSLSSFSALAALVGWKEGHLPCKKFSHKSFESLVLGTGQT